MKRLFGVLLFCAIPAHAAPFVVSDPLAAGVTHCGVLLDAQPKRVSLEGIRRNEDGMLTGASATVQ
jgi:hypothetical protein